MSFNRQLNKISELVIEVEKFFIFNEKLSDYMKLMSFYLDKVAQMKPINYLDEIIVMTDFIGRAKDFINNKNKSDSKIYDFEIKHIRKFFERIRFWEINTVEKVEELYVNN